MPWLAREQAPGELPPEWEYADDLDFANINSDALERLLEQSSETFEDHNLFVNKDKTERVHVRVQDQPGAREEPWRGCKSLGSLLCSTKDMDRWIVLAEAAFRRLWSLWVRPQHVSLRRRLRLD